MTRMNEEPDFASATMMRLIMAGLRRQGIAVGLQPPSGARVPRTQKRDVLDVVLREHGPLPILSIADAGSLLSLEPVVQALLRARDVADLLDRWQRLERFSHGRHTVEIQRIGDGCFRLHHRARDAGPPPSTAESLVVLALLTILTEMIGSTGVSLTSATGEVWRSNGSWREPAALSLLEGMVLSAGLPHMPADTPSGIHSGDSARELRGQLMADPVRRWTLSDLAARAGLSPRTLQRRLSQGAVSFSRLVAEARLQVAAAHLCNAAGPGLAEIGFLAGYSDQAHFTRSFHRAVGTTPGAYRADFGR